MKLYYHKTGGGAEYYSIKNVEGTDEGAVEGVILRTDGNELEVFTSTLKENGIKLIIN